MQIKNVIICGLGAVGLTYASKLKNICNLKILADKARIAKFVKNPPRLNNKEVELNFITPEDFEKQDLIIISVKNESLNSAIRDIKNFVGENTIIMSLLNGITSEEEIAEVYGKNKVVHSYFVGHSAVRENNNVTQDGVGKIVFGTPFTENKKSVLDLENFFSKNNIDYEIPENILYSMWLKFTLNIFSNQLSAIMNLTFGELKNEKILSIAKELIKEVQKLAKAENIKGYEHLEKESIKLLSLMCDEGKTSMLQDILAKRKTEVDIFAGEIIKLGKIHKIPTPYNEVIYRIIKKIENEF